MHWTSLEIRRLLQLRQAGHSQAECAVLLGRSLGSVTSACFRFGPTRSYRRLHDVEQQLRQLHAAGLCSARISRKLELSLSSVKRWLTQLGLQSPGCACPEVRAERKANYQRWRVKPSWYRWAKARYGRCRGRH